MISDKDMSEADDTSAKKTIMVVEDDTDIGEILVQAIREETAYHAILASNALQALNWAEQSKPDLILLDYRLPCLNGIQMYDQLQANPELRHIPVIMISANMPAAEARKRELIYLHKPIELNGLFDALEKALAEPA